eukprot:2395159-Prymnesium_polylepis.1
MTARATTTTRPARAAAAGHRARARTPPLYCAAVCTPLRFETQTGRPPQLQNARARGGSGPPSCSITRAEGGVRPPQLQ